MPCKKTAALALGVALWLAGGSAASADNTVFVNTDTEISVNNQHIPYILQKDGGVKFTIKNGGAVLYLSSAESGNIITVESGGKAFGGIGMSGCSIIGGVSNNQVTVAGDVYGDVAGGASMSAPVSGNRIP